MLEQTTHIVHRQRFAIRGTSAEQAEEVQERVSAWSRDYLPKLLEQIFDKVHNAESILSIDKVALHLTTVSLENIEAALEQQVREALQKELEEIALNAQVSPSEASQLLETKDNALRTLEYYLENGALPWWYQGTAAKMSLLFAELLEEHPQALLAILRKTVRQVAVVQRLVQLAKSKGLNSLGELTFPSAIELPQLLLNGLPRTQTWSVYSEVLTQAQQAWFTKPALLIALLKAKEDSEAKTLMLQYLSVELLLVAPKETLQLLEYSTQVQLQKESKNEAIVQLINALVEQLIFQAAVLDSVLKETANQLLLRRVANASFLNTELAKKLKARLLKETPTLKRAQEEISSTASTKEERTTDLSAEETLQNNVLKEENKEDTVEPEGEQPEIASTSAAQSELDSNKQTSKSESDSTELPQNDVVHAKAQEEASSTIAAKTKEEKALHNAAENSSKKKGTTPEQKDAPKTQRSEEAPTASTASNKEQPNAPIDPTQAMPSAIEQTAATIEQVSSKADEATQEQLAQYQENRTEAETTKAYAKQKTEREVQRAAEQAKVEELFAAQQLIDSPWNVPQRYGGEVLWVENAGLVILWPFLSVFFNGFDLLEENDFKNDEARYLAVALLHGLSGFDDEAPEDHQLHLNKILCGLDPIETCPIPTLNENHQLEIDELLNVVIERWTVLKGMQPKDLQHAFIQHKGRIKRGNPTWEINVEQQTPDILLNMLPWGIGVVKLPWLEQMILVEWPTQL